MFNLTTGFIAYTRATLTAITSSFHITILFKTNFCNSLCKLYAMVELISDVWDVHIYVILYLAFQPFIWTAVKKYSALARIYGRVLRNRETDLIIEVLNYASA